MKKIKYLVSIICLTVLFTGCSNQENKTEDLDNQISTENQHYKDDYTLIYSNLINSEDKEEIIEQLTEAGVQSEYISEFIKNADWYNELMTGMGGLATEFTRVESSQPLYDELFTYDNWDETKYDYQDFNCRLTAFDLFKDYIESDTVYTGDTYNLMLDLDVIENNPRANFTENDTEKLINLYSYIKAESHYNRDEHINTIKESLSTRGITFKENDKLSLINVYLHSYEFNELFVGHAGVLIENEDDFLFIEKYAPVMPYQVSKFKTKKELSSYLMDRLHNGNKEDGVAPIIFENGAEMKY